MPDAIEKIHGATVQHGPLNNRVYLMQLNSAALHQVVPALDFLAEEKGYGKIIAKIPADAWAPFEAAGYAQEALVPGFFRGRIDALFVAKYLRPERARVGKAALPTGGPDANETLPKTPGQAGRADKGVLAPCTPEDVEVMGAIYRRMFQSYPFPIQEPSYLRHLMGTGVKYYGVRVKGRLWALAAIECDRPSQTAEMTDFATVPEGQGQGMAGRLLAYMDAQARHWSIKTSYAITRAGSPAMNRVFKVGGYRYAGFLKNNTQIDGRIESMIVWYKRLDDQGKGLSGDRDGGFQD